MKQFYKPIKIKTPGNNVFFWCCMHLRHDPNWTVPLWKMRGFESVAEHDDHIFKAWDSTLNEDSVIFLLGDNAFSQEAPNILAGYLKLLPYKECYMMPGNHTAGWKQLFELADEEGKLVFDGKTVWFPPNYLELYVDGCSVVLSHYPILSFNGQGANYRAKENTAFHFFGHVHNSLTKSDLGRMYLDTCVVEEVSVEHYVTPPSFAQLREKLRHKTPVPVDHHKADTRNLHG